MITSRFKNQHANRPTALQLQEQLRWMNFQSLGNLDENLHRRGTLTALNPAYVIRMNVRSFSKSLLTELCPIPIPEHSFADDFICRFRHRCLRKQKREGVTTHAACRMPVFRACNFPPNFSNHVMSEVDTELLIRGMRKSGAQEISPEIHSTVVFSRLNSCKMNLKDALTANVQAHALQSQQKFNVNCQLQTKGTPK